MTYSIRDLVRQSGETKRTIRYYVQLGLLPPPERVGRGASYSDEHLELLRRIRQLQTEGYTLQQVGARLSSASIPVNQLVDMPNSDAIAAPTLAASVRSLAMPRNAVPDALKPTQWAAATGNQSRQQLWRRVSITPDIELFVRGRSARTAARLERVLRQALGEETLELKQERME